MKNIFIPIKVLAAEPPSFSEMANDLNSQGIGLTDPKMNTLGGIISTLLPYLLTLGGLVLFFMLVSGGFSIMTSISDPKGSEKGKQQVTNAILGFIILFISYWIFQILEIMLGINIFGS
ncbi:hypothetical protein ACFL1M_04955 [Patescibacteria group bacterium]